MVKNKSEGKEYIIIGSSGKEYVNSTQGTLCVHKRLKIYDKLDYPSTLGHIAKGHYVKQRVFYKGKEIEIAAGYSSCNICMPERYKDH